MKNLNTFKTLSKLYRLLLVTVLAALSFSEVFGAAKTFTGPGNFSDASKWNSGALPVAGADLRITGICYIDSSSLIDNVAFGTIDLGRSGAGSFVWPSGSNTRLNVAGISTSNTGIIDMTNGGTLILNGTLSSSNITFISGLGTVQVLTNMTLPSAYTTYRNLTVQGAIVTLGTNTTFNGNVTITSGSLLTNNFDMNIAGNFSKASGTTFTPGSGTITFNGTGAQAINGTATSQTFNNFIVNKSAGTLSKGGSTDTITVKNFTLTAGTFTAPASLTATGFITLTAGTFTAGSSVTVGDNWTRASGTTFTPGTGTVTFNAAGAQGIRGTITSQTFYNVIVFKASGTLNVAGSTDTLTVNNFTQTTGSFSAPTNMNINGNLVLSAGTYTAATRTNIKGNWTQNSGSTFTHNSGTVTMNGSSSQTIAGTSTPAFYKLIVGNASGVVLGTNTTISNDIDLSSGSVTLSDYNLTLGTATISNSSSTHYIVTKDDATTGGFLIRTVAAVAKLFPVGNSTSYTPVTVTNAGTSDDFRVRVFSGVFANGTSGGLHPDLLHSVNKTWLVEESVAGGSNATLTMQWNQSDENASFARGNCALFHFTGGLWDMPSSFTACSTVSPGVFSRSRSSITSFSPFSMGDRIVPLPVELISFTARKIEKSVVLNWSTATEINNSHFAIERSTDGTSFTAIDSVAGAGNSNSVIDYNYTDMNAIPATNSYYRLRQVDFDGKTSYSAVQLIKVIQTMTIGDIYPMPAVENINVPVESLKGGNCTADIYDLSGKLVHSETFTLGVASQTLSISTADLKQGMYVLSINNSNGENHTMKLLK